MTCRSLMAALSVDMVTVNMLLSVFFLSGVQTGCEKKPVLFIKTPKQIEALRGSCLLIPCSFGEKQEEEFDSKKKTFGVWIKNDPAFNNNPYNVIYNSSKTQNSYNMNITGDLSQKNCTTMIYDLNGHWSDSDKYFFRIENGLFKATASCDSLQITVRESAWKPRIEISGDEKKKKNSVTITCSAFTPCPHSPPGLTWDLQKASPRLIENPDGTFRTEIQATISLSKILNGYNISCLAKYPVNEPQPSWAAADSWVNLNCSIRPKSPVSSITWYKNSPQGANKVAERDVYRFNVTKGEAYHCETAAEDEGSYQLQISLISVAAVLICICLVVCVWFYKHKHQTPPQIQSQTAEDLILQVPANQTDEEIHYEDVKFLMKKREASSVSEDHSRQQQETVYSQVNVSKSENRSTQPAEGLEELYSQVKKN